MKPFDVIILTDKRYLEDSESNLYKHNVFYEDFLVLEALRQEDLKVNRLAWDDENFDWSSTKSVLFRSTWDYFDRFDEFSIWLEKVKNQTILFNSEKIIRWNIDKHYLNDLKNNGVHIAETYFIEKGCQQSLQEIIESLGWNEVVLKPCVSGAARHTHRLNSRTIEAHEGIFNQLIANESMMLLPFQHQIVKKGEVSIMVFNGQYTHAILKKAKKGDFRVQDDFGGTVHDYQPTKEEIAFAENAVKACFELPIYARVDIFTDNNNQIALLELELVEPELWFRYHPTAANVLAKALKQKLI